MKIIFILILILVSNLFSFGSKEYNYLFNTKERVVVDLRGNWTLENQQKKIYLPFSSTSNDELTLIKDIKIDKKLSKIKLWHLYFAGLDSDVEVYVNENFVGKYIGVMTPFYVKIPENFIDGEDVTIKLKSIPLENYSFITKTMGIDNMRYYTSITRDVLLVGTSRVWVNNIFNVESKFKEKKAILQGNVLVNSGILSRKNDSLNYYKENMPIRIEIKLLDNSNVIETYNVKEFNIESERSIEQNFKFVLSDYKLWSIENPHLYELKVSIYSNNRLLDSYSHNVGIKQTSFKDNQFVINGKKLFIKGVDYIDDYENKGATLSISDFEKDISLIKKLGSNLIRFKYLPPHPYMISLCDKYGLLTLIDLPAYRLPNRIYKTNEIKIRLENISRRFESAYSTNVSLISWGLGSEIEYDKSPSNTYRFEKNNNFYRTYNINNLKLLGNEDLTIVSIYNSLVNYDNLIEIIDKQLSNQNAVVLNFGLPVQLKNHNGYLDLLSVQNQANIIRNLFHIAEKKKLAGCIINSYNDYLLQNPTLRTNNKDLYLSSTGLVERDRKSRLSYETTQSLFNEEKEPILDAGSHSEKNTITFIILGLVLLLIFIFLLNKIKRFREYFKRSIVSPFNFYADIRDQRLISTSLTLILSLMISFTLGIFFSNFLFHFRNFEAEQYLIKLIIPNINFQKNIFKMIWQPEPFMLIISAAIFLKFFVISAILKLFSSVASGKIFFSDTFIIAVWSFIPVILILPFSIISQKLFLINEGIAITLIILLLILLIWSFFRMIKATSVVFDISSWKVYSTVSIIVIVLIILPLTLYQIKNSFIDYLVYFTKFYL